MRRELCTVEKIDPERLLLRNQNGEVCRVPRSWAAEAKVGNLVFLLYTQRRQTGEGLFEADIHAVYPASLMPRGLAKQAGRSVAEEVGV